MNRTPPWQLRTPADDGQVLLWPDPAGWAELAARSAERRSARQDDSTRLLDLPLSQARALARADLVGLADPAGRASPDPLRPWVMTGHQTVPYHPGVWVKHVAVRATARAVGGEAINLNVDHDLPHAGFQLTWPAMDADGELVRRGDLPLDHDQPFERQPAPSSDRLGELCRRIQGDLDRLMRPPRGCPFALSERGGAARTSFGDWFAAVRAELDRGLGLTLAEAMTSRLARGDGFLLLVCDAIARGERMRSAYNESVRQARARTGHDPAPELRVADGGVELGFWSLRDGVPGRHRLFAATGGGRVRLWDERGEIGQAPAAEFESADRAIASIRRLLADAGAGVRPRALTLTLFARLLLADLFVHGVGGAHYDAATDLLFERLYGLPSPPYAVASATLRLPLDVATATAEQLRLARHKVRDMRFNPQRHLPPGELSPEPARSLLAAKWAAVERNQALRDQGPRDRDEGPTHVRSRERAELFARVRGLNRELLALMDDDLARCQDVVARLSRQRQAGEVALARDYFYGLFPAADLARLAGRVTEQLGHPEAT